MIGELRFVRLEFYDKNFQRCLKKYNYFDKIRNIIYICIIYSIKNSMHRLFRINHSCQHNTNACQLVERTYLAISLLGQGYYLSFGW